MQWRDDPATVRPMLATLTDSSLTQSGSIYEPKYDGIRALVHVASGKTRPDVRIWSRLGNDKTGQFPSLVNALAPLATSAVPMIVCNRSRRLMLSRDPM